MVGDPRFSLLQDFNQRHQRGLAVSLDDVHNLYVNFSEPCHESCAYPPHQYIIAVAVCRPTPSSASLAPATRNAERFLPSKRQRSLHEQRGSYVCSLGKHRRTAKRQAQHKTKTDGEPNRELSVNLIPLSDAVGFLTKRPKERGESTSLNFADKTTPKCMVLALEVVLFHTPVRLTAVAVAPHYSPLSLPRLVADAQGSSTSAVRLQQFRQWRATHVLSASLLEALVTFFKTISMLC